MDYLIRFSQSHETFRLPEIQSLALIEGIDMKVISYSLDVSSRSITQEGQSTTFTITSSLQPLHYPAP
jgi:tRNA G10  N-methylase Trm11